MTIDLDALEAAVAEGEKKNFFVAPIVKELIAELRERRAQVDGYRMTLLAEVERLRGEVSYLRACVPPTRPTDYGHEVWTAALRAEVAAERAAVVAWLRSQVSQAAGDDDYAYDHAADVIERGEHRREGEP
jgi:hypothetical protein